MKSFTPEEVAAEGHIIIDGGVFDISKFARVHPGGEKILVREAGKDATKKFHMFHKKAVLKKYAPKLQVGYLKGKEPAAASSTPASEIKSDDVREYGELVPYCDPNWYQGRNSPYYTEGHRAWRAKIRKFTEEVLMPNVSAWDEKGEIPKWVFEKCGDEGILPGVIGHWPTEYVGEGPKDYDPFHELILIDEMARCGSGGVLWGLCAGLTIGLPPVMIWGNQYLRDMVARDCLLGRKVICLAITEPEAGSDVANLHTTARREGDHYILNGAKKWITNGIFADYFTVACRTGGPGSKGLSFLLVEKNMPGVSTRRMKCMGVFSSGTTYITFEDVKVPVRNLIGKENEAFKYIMYNFNHERWMLIAQCQRLARTCLEESFKYSLKRKTFGKRLIDHQMIRFKIAEMARQIEATQHWLENVTYQMKTMDKEESNPKLGGEIALLKAQATKVFEYCARESAQIFGGASYVRGGVGEKVERLYREVRAYAIPGGSEEIMIDFAARQAERGARKAKL